MATKKHLKIESKKTAVLIGLGFSIVFTLIILRGLLFSRGFVAFGDATFSHDMSLNRDIFTQSWSQFLGWDNSRRVMNLPFMLPLNYLFNDTGTFTKALYFFVFTLMGTISFSVAFSWLQDIGTKVLLSYAGALVVALIYVCSTYTVFVTSQFGGLFSYALLPLTFYFTRAAFRQHSYSVKTLLKYGMILGLILMLATTMYYVFSIHMIVLFVTALGQLIPRLVTEGRQVKGYLLYSLCLSGLTVAMFALFWAWYIIPFLISHSMGLREFRHIIINADYIRGVSKNGDIFNVVRMLGFPDEAMLGSSGNFRTLWLVSTLAVPIMAITAVILRPKNRDTIVLGILAIVGILLAKGSNGPFGDQHLWLFSNFELLFTTGGLYFPIRAIPLVILPYALLSAFTVTRILERVEIRKRLWCRILSVTGVTIVCGLICVNGFPLFSGDNRSTLNPMLVPQPYNDVNSWLSEDTGNYRVAWLPPSDTVGWNPHINSVDQWQSMHVAYIPPLLSSKPVTSVTGVGLTNTPVERERLEQYISYLLGKGQSSSIGKILAIENAKYILYHDDILGRENFQKLFTDLRESGDLTQVYSKDYISIFENKDYLPYIQTKDKVILVVGGLDSLGLIEKTNFGVPDKRSFIFLEQNASNSDQLEDTLKSTDYIIFYGNKDFDDFALSSLDRKYYYPALDCWQNDYRSPWTRDFYYSLTWYQRILTQSPSNWDFDFNLGIMFTDKPEAELNFKVTTTADSCEIWARNFLTNAGAGLTASVDGKQIASINSYSSGTQEFKWQKLGAIGLSQGEHEIKLKTISGFNAVNAIAVVPRGIMQQHMKELQNQIQSNGIKLLYWSDCTIMTPIQTMDSKVTENPADWKPSDTETKISLDTTNLFEGIASLKVEGSGTKDGWRAVSCSSFNNDLSNFNNLNLSLFFKEIPENIKSVNIYIVGHGEWIEWDISRNRLQNGKWQRVELTLSKPDGRMAFGTLTDPLLLCVAVTIPEGEFAYNIANIMLVHSSKVMDFNTVDEQDYIATALATPNKGTGNVSINIDGTETTLFVNEEGWLQTPPIRLKEGNHQIVINTQNVSIQGFVVYPVKGDYQSLTDIFDTEVEASVLDYKVISPTNIQINVKIDKPCILAFGESYHSMWNATDDEGNKLPKLVLNSVTNGFVVERMGTYQINVEFVLEKYFTRGKIISGLTLVSVLVLLVLIYWRERKIKVKPDNVE